MVREVGSPSGDAGRPALTALHVSDVHITDDPRRQDALDLVFDAAIAEDVDLVIVAGDLFDSPKVGPESVGRVIDALARLKRPTLVIPGNHDCIDEFSMYHRVDLAEAGAHVVFVGDPAGEEIIFHDLGLAAWARGIEDHTIENRPLEGYQPSAPNYWRIVVAHGHYVAAGAPADRSSPIREEEIAALECDYLALGHWHRFLEFDVGDVVVSYSGSPTESARPGFNLVRFEPGQRVQVEHQLLPADYAWGGLGSTRVTNRRP